MSLIVIVDDRVSNRNIFAKLAVSIEPDVTVRTFGDPVEALEWLADNTPDLVITDYKMPNLNGAELIRRFRMMPACEDVPVIVITVYEERSFRLCALEAGATDFLHSPVDHHEFVTRARNLLKLQKNQLMLAGRATELQRELEVSERSRKMELRDSSERLGQVIDTVPVLISAVDRGGMIKFVNAGYAEFSAVNATEVVGRLAQELYGKEEAARHLALDRIVFDSGKALPSFEEDLPDSKGELHSFQTTKSPLINFDGRISAVLTSSLDVTARKRTEARMRHLAHHDVLTDLPNRTLLLDLIRKQTARSRRGAGVFALHVIDLDGFKSINDLMGHSAGDQYIIKLSKKLRASLREGDMLARLEGDKFAILQTEVTRSEDAAECATRALDTIENAIDFKEAPVAITASVGIVMHPGDGEDEEELLKNADLAMYQAKSLSGNNFCFYASDMNARARNAALLDIRLRRAIENQEFLLYYQPLVDLKSGRTIGAEALLRWNDPEFGIVSPGQFLPRAEENGLIVAINEWVLERACRDAQAWPDLDGKPLEICVNLSPVQFRLRTLPLHVARVLTDTGLAPSRLDLEVTEGILMQDTQTIRDELGRLVDMGVNLSIDDFGTGYSSLNYVKRMPVSRLKIDQSFVQNIHGDENDAAIVRAIITLGHSLKMEVVAEGVEKAEQLERLRDEHCDVVQGYYFARPMPNDEFVALITGEQNELSQIA